MDSKRGMEGVVPMGEVIDVASGVPESLELSGGAGEISAGDGRLEEIGGVGQERTVLAEMPPVTEVLEGQEVQGQAQGDLVNFTTDIATGDGERLEREWEKATDRLMGETRDKPRLRLASFDEYRRNYMGKRFGRKFGGGK